MKGIARPTAARGSPPITVNPSGPSGAPSTPFPADAALRRLELALNCKLDKARRESGSLKGKRKQKFEQWYKGYVTGLAMACVEVSSTKAAVLPAGNGPVARREET